VAVGGAGWFLNGRDWSIFEGDMVFRVWQWLGGSVAVAVAGWQLDSTLYILKTIFPRKINKKTLNFPVMFNVSLDFTCNFSDFPMILYVISPNFICIFP
jgi:hypothetical protein